MKVLKRISIAISILFFIMGCRKNFEEINKNPNLITEISPGTLLNEIVYNISSNNMQNSYNVNSELMQVQLGYPQYYGGVQRYEILENTGQSQWNSSYKWIKNAREMYKAAELNNAPNYQAVALTLQAWIFSNLTDNFGDIPYSEASLSDEGILQPKYDDQNSVYTDLLNNLEKASQLYDVSKGMVYGTDILFSNNVLLWQKFTNSLYLRLLLRTSNSSPDAFNKMREILNNPSQYPIISSQEESVILKITGISPNVSPWARALDFSTQHAGGKFFIDILNSLDDPRLPKFVGKANRQGIDIGYKGIPSGYDDSSFDYSPSYMNNQQVIVPMIVPILTFAEVCFIKAELAQRGYFAQAEDHFKAGIKAAVFTWTNTNISDDYFQSPIARYDGSLERILLHKYLALYLTDFQQWSEYRRTGFPVLPKTTSMMNDAKVPARLMYPAIQKVYNPTNYELAIQKMGSDDINKKIWWAK